MKRGPVLCILVWLFPFTLFAQTKKISGTVKDESGQPVPGATVTLPDKTGTLTNEKGTFTINAKEGTSLTVSSIGFETYHTDITNGATYNIVLKSKAGSLNDVVVVGYGVQKRATLTGAISTIDRKVVENRPVTNAVAALQGAAPGLIVTRSSGQPGKEGWNLNIRGATSINDGGNGPLVIIDGVEGDLTLVNPNDIESISVLKDAEAAIYGAKSAGGVIIVTTKKGSVQKLKVMYSGMYSLNRRYSVPQRLHSWEEAEMQNTARRNAGLSDTWSAQQIGWMKGTDSNYVSNPTDPNSYGYYYDIDYIDLLTRKTSSSQNHNVSVSGGNNGTQYLFSLGYFDQNGVFKYGPDGAKRYNARFNVNTRLNNYLSLDSRIAYSQGRTNAPSTAVAGDYGLLYNIYQQRQLSPVWVPGYEGERYANAGGPALTYFQLVSGGYNNFLQHTLDGVFTLKLENLVKGLVVRGIYSPHLQQSNSDIFVKSIPVWNKVAITSYVNNPNSMSKSRATANSDNVQFLADYDWSIKEKHKFHVLGGFQYQFYKYNFDSATAKALVSNDVPSFNFIANPSIIPGLADNIQTNTWVSWFGRLNYSFNNKYLLDLTLRNDATSRLSPGNRGQWFYGVSGGWRVSGENWFHGALPVFDELKLRVSWGRQGNAMGADPNVGNYDYLASLNRGAAYPFNNVSNPSLFQNRLPSTTIGWETISTRNAGIDIAMLKSRLAITAEYYIRNNDNMLAQLQLPSTLGVVPSKTNAASLKTYGWETAITWRDKINQFNYWVSFNIGDAKNEITRYLGANAVLAGLNPTVKGYPINSIFGYIADGYFTSQDEVAKSAFQDKRNGPGDIKYKDLDGSGTIDAGLGRGDSHGDLVYLGNTSPRYNYGATLGFEFKGFDFSAFIQGVGERKMLLYPQVTVPFVDSWRQPWAINQDYWTPDNPNAKFPRLYMNGTQNTVVSSHWVQNAAYIRLKNLQVGYTIPPSITQKAKIDRARIYFSGQDIWESNKMWYKYFDAENPNNASFNYPFFRSYAIGLNVTF